MNEKIISKAWLFLVFLALFSCRTEEITVSEIVQQNQEYTNKSLWKEDEVFIKNVKKIYDENANEVKMESRYGKIYWDYATSMNTYDETYMIAPILKDNKVVSYVEAKRIGSRVYFGFIEDDKETNDFFNTLVFTEKENLSVVEPSQHGGNNNEISASIQSVTTRVLQCKTVTKTLIVGYVEGGGPDQGGEISETYTETICKFVDGPAEQDTCLTDYDANGNCNGGGGDGGGGYSYPSPEEEELEDDCAKVKQNLINPKFKEKYNELNTQSNLNGINEKGIFERAAPPGNNLPSSFIPISNQSCTTDMDLPSNVAGIYGLFHIHNNVNCDNGKINVKAPSPVDMRTFFHILMKQANQYKGSYSEAYSVVITSYGSYMLKYNSTSWPSNVTGSDFAKWQKWYESEFQNLENKGMMNAENVEKTFAQFLKEVVNVDGLDVFMITENSATKVDYKNIDPNTKKPLKIECP